MLISRFIHVRLFTTLLTVACQVPLSMGFSKQEYWSGLQCLPPGDFFTPRDRTLISYVSCIGKWVLYHWYRWETPRNVCVCAYNIFNNNIINQQYILFNNKFNMNKFLLFKNYDLKKMN